MRRSRLTMNAYATTVEHNRIHDWSASVLLTSEAKNRLVASPRCPRNQFCSASRLVYEGPLVLSGRLGVQRQIRSAGE